VSRGFSRRRLIILAGLIATIAIAIPSLVNHFDRQPQGAALDDRGGGGGAGGPVVPGEPLSFGLVTTRNVSRDPVQLLSARLLWLDPGLRLLGFTANKSDGNGGVAITARGWPIGNGVALQDYPPLAPDANQDQVTVVFGLTVDAGHEGKALGVVVRYRQKGKVKEQLFKEQAFVCAVPTVDPNARCPGHGTDFDVAKDFDSELSARRRKG
jgi:hypothetical protein